MLTLTATALFALMTTPNSGAVREDIDGDTMADWHGRLAAASAPAEPRDVERLPSRWYLSHVRLERFGYRPGERVALHVGRPLRARHEACTIELLDPTGRVAPENTLPAIRLAVEKGAHQIEFDVQMSKDGQLVIMHDPTLDRTTNGKGPVGNLTFAELRALDAGSWKGEQFAGTTIPTFGEVLHAVPPGILLNCHLRWAPGLAAKVTRQVVEMGRLDQCFLACGTQQAAEAKAVCPKIKICNMSGQRGPNSDYPDQTIALKAEFIQLVGWHDSMPAVAAKLHKHGVTVNYFGTSDAAMMRRLIDSGVNYILTDHLDLMLKVLAEYGIQPVRVHRSETRPSGSGPAPTAP